VSITEEPGPVTCHLCKPHEVVDGNIFDHLRLFHPGWDEAPAPPPLGAPEPELVIRMKDFPHGVRCGECHALFRDGDRYRDRLTGMIGDTPAYEIVCLVCAGRREVAAQ
jgi:hypothetical protein